MPALQQQRALNALAARIDLVPVIRKLVLIGWKAFGYGGGKPPHAPVQEFRGLVQ
jgi:hypothetical protein